MLTKSLVAAASAGAVLLTASPALADDRGLYGSGDPTYDGVYRQSLSLIALKAAGAEIPKPAVRWLTRQQCADGGFMAYRADGAGTCQAPDAVTFSGQDSNSTAVAAAALAAIGRKPEARRAASWLASRRSSDGGWAYYPADGAVSDTNSTALAVGALRAVRGEGSARFLRSVQRRCDAPRAQRGGLAFDQTSTTVNDNATSQAAWILSGGLEPPARRAMSPSTPRLTCKGGAKDTATVTEAALGYLGTRLVTTKGDLPYGGGYSGTDYVGAAAASLALAYNGSGRKAVKLTHRFLQKNADTWIAANGDDAPGALAMLILVDRSASGTRTNSLVKRLGKTLTP